MGEPEAPIEESAGEAAMGTKRGSNGRAGGTNRAKVPEAPIEEVMSEPEAPIEKQASGRGPS
eukprot:637398-Alexandrium_andersonii.AAC.1